MHIVFAASECVPFAKSGGLADVVGALPQELARLGHQVTLYMPYYRQVAAQMQEKKYAIRSVTIPFPYYNRFAGIVDGGEREGVRYYFVDSPELFDREQLYGTQAGEYLDNWERFGLFSRAVLEASKQLGVPDVFHVHDWQSSMLPVYLRTTYGFDPVLRKVGTLLTIHNMGYQGLFPPEVLDRVGLPKSLFTIEGMEFYGRVNFLKGGIIFTDWLTTVSRGYASEIQTAEYGCGLDGVIRRRADRLLCRSAPPPTTRRAFSVKMLTSP